MPARRVEGEWGPFGFPGSRDDSSGSITMEGGGGVSGMHIVSVGNAPSDADHDDGSNVNGGRSVSVDDDEQSEEFLQQHWAFRDARADVQVDDHDDVLLLMRRLELGGDGFDAQGGGGGCNGSTSPPSASPSAQLRAATKLHALACDAPSRYLAVNYDDGQGIAVIAGLMDCGGDNADRRHPGRRRSAAAAMPPLGERDTLRRYLGWVLAELACDQGRLIIEQGGLEALLVAARAGLDEALPAAAWACALLSTTIEHSKPMLDEGAVWVLALAARIERGITRQHALFAIANLAAQPTLHGRLLEGDADVVGVPIALLQAHASSYSESARLDEPNVRQALRLVSNLSLSLDFAERILQLDPDLAMLPALDDSAAEVTGQALRLVVNLTSHVRLTLPVARSVDIVNVAALLCSQVPTLKRDSTRAVCNVLASSGAEAAIGSTMIIAHVIPKLIEVIRSPAPAEVLRVAARALSHISEDSCKRASVSSGAIQALRRLNRTCEHEEVQQASHDAALALGTVLSPTSRRALTAMLSCPAWLPSTRSPRRLVRSSPLCCNRDESPAKGSTESTPNRSPARSPLPAPATAVPLSLRPEKPILPVLQLCAGAASQRSRRRSGKVWTPIQQRVATNSPELFDGLGAPKTRPLGAAGSNVEAASEETNPYGLELPPSLSRARRLC